MRELNNNLNIFVSCHKNFYVPNNKYLIPIQVGAQLAPSKLDMIGDDSGNNISSLNKHFCELTAQYWAWKNVNCEYYGFFHYRRYFSFNSIKKTTYDNITDDVLDKIGINDKKIEECIAENDIVVTKPWILSDQPRGSRTVYNQYKNTPLHNIEDMDRTIQIIHELHPEYDHTVKKVLNSKKTYLYNMFIMKKEWFNEYCSWLFSILLKLNEEKDYSLYSMYSARLPGFLAERLLTVFVTYIKEKNSSIRVKELEPIFFIEAQNPYLLPKYDNKIGICFAGDNEYAKHIGLAITSLALKSNPDKNYDIIVFQNDISMHNQQMIAYGVKDYPNISLRFLRTVDYLAGTNLYIREYCNQSTYLRFAILDLLRNFKRVIYLDGDIICNRDIADMYEEELGDNYVAAAVDSTAAAWCNLNTSFGRAKKQYHIETLGLKDPYSYFCAGIMIFNVEVMKNHITTKQLFEIASSRKWDYQDQDILNYICQGKVKYLDMSWNYMPFHDIPMTEHIAFPAPAYIYKQFLKAKENPSIIHYAGQAQPMNEWDVHCADIYWNVARKCIFYEELLYDMYVKAPKLQEKYTVKRKIKNILKRFFPKDTKRGTYIRKVWHTIKGR